MHGRRASAHSRCATLPACCSCVHAAVHGTVRISATEGLAGLFVRRGLLALTARHPELSLEFVSDNLVAELGRRGSPWHRATAIARGPADSDEPARLGSDGT